MTGLVAATARLLALEVGTADLVATSLTEFRNRWVVA